ncbi:hypothetical protein M5689_022323 [Euphorbia peplus]|nr:hypothetical protein M5689_022323 [Euphorbia peplus]
MIKLLFSGYALLFVILLLMFQTTDTAPDCRPSSCGGTNISYPFRLQTDPVTCGAVEHELSCENNVTVLYPVDGGKYYVKAINYDNFTIRLVDRGVDKDNCSSLPSFFPFGSYYGPYTFYKYKQKSESESEWEKLRAETINFIKCENAVNSSGYLDTSPCINSSLSHSETVYTYAYFGKIKGYDLREGCALEMASLTSPRRDSETRNISFIEVHRQMAFGFEVSWNLINCRHCKYQMCYLDTKDHLQCLVNNSTDDVDTAFHVFTEYVRSIFIFIGEAIKVESMQKDGEQSSVEVSESNSSQVEIAA